MNLNELLWMEKISYCLLTVMGWSFRELYKNIECGIFVEL